MADSAHDFSFSRLAGGTIDLKAFAGRPVVRTEAAWRSHLDRLAAAA